MNLKNLRLLEYKLKAKKLREGAYGKYPILTKDILIETEGSEDTIELKAGQQVIISLDDDQNLTLSTSEHSNPIVLDDVVLEKEVLSAITYPEDLPEMEIEEVPATQALLTDYPHDDLLDQDVEGDIPLGFFPVEDSDPEEMVKQVLNNSPVELIIPVASIVADNDEVLQSFADENQMTISAQDDGVHIIGTAREIEQLLDESKLKPQIREEIEKNNYFKGFKESKSVFPTLKATALSISESKLYVHNIKVIKESAVKVFGDIKSFKEAVAEMKGSIDEESGDKVIAYRESKDKDFTDRSEFLDALEKNYGDVSKLFKKSWDSDPFDHEKVEVYALSDNTSKYSDDKDYLESNDYIALWNFDNNHGFVTVKDLEESKSIKEADSDVKDEIEMFGEFNPDANVGIIFLDTAFESEEEFLKAVDALANPEPVETPEEIKEIEDFEDDEDIMEVEDALDDVASEKFESVSKKLSESTVKKIKSVLI